MYAVEIVGMCSGKNMPRFSSYESAFCCFQDAVDFCRKFGHDTSVRLLDLKSDGIVIEAVVNPTELPF